MKFSLPKTTFFVAAILAAGVVFVLFSEDIRKSEIRRAQKLEYTHNRAVDQFSRGIENLASLVAGMRGFVNLSKEIPDTFQFQEFIQNQLNDIGSTDSIAISVIDKNHIFTQAFTRNEIDPVHLVGREVRSLGSNENRAMIDSLLLSNKLRMFPPINLIEGWLGIPVNFRIFRDGEVEGYVAPILNFESIVSDVYDEETIRDFVFKFQTQDGHYFDRSRIYNDTKVYNNSTDPEYYTNYNVNDNSFISTSKIFYGYEVIISTAYKKEALVLSTYRWFLLIINVVFLAFLGLIVWQWQRHRSLGYSLANANGVLEKQSEVVVEKNQQLEILNKTKDKFFSIIGHDIRQPLHSIEGLIYLLKNKELSGEELDTVLEGLGESTAATTNLLNDLLSWGLSQTGDIGFAPKHYMLDDLILDELELLKQPIESKGITLVQNGVHLSIYVDKPMMLTVLRNLLSNAIKFTFPGGKIEVNARKNDDEIVIEIADNGTGMTQKEIENLFAITLTESQIGTQGERGTGLGLQLCSEFIKKHNGSISAASEKGKGTSFFIRLPVR